MQHNTVINGMTIETTTSGAAYIKDGITYLTPSEIKLRLWDEGFVQIGGGNQFVPVQTLEIGQVCKFKVDGYVIAVKRVEEKNPKARIIKLADQRRYRKSKTETLPGDDK